MGASGSKSGKDNELASPPPPYLGEPVMYHFLNFDVPLHMKVEVPFFSRRVNISTINVDSYFPSLMQTYEEGFRMLTFTGVPGSVTSRGKSNLKFQGVFRKQSADDSGQRWALRVEKSILQSQMVVKPVFIGPPDVEAVSNTVHIFDVIREVTQAGGRFVCVEITGVTPQSLVGGINLPQAIFMGVDIRNENKDRDVAVDVFFEMPLAGIKETYIYQIVPAPIKAHFTTGNVQITCDWQGIMTEYLDQGWKLVEIFLDRSIQTSHSFGTFDMTNNTFWVFEKPTSRVNDPTPIYEGCRTEFKVVITATSVFTFGGARLEAKTDWETHIIEMGNYGWELVRILQVPDIRRTVSKIIMKVWMFFQRKIVRSATPPLAYTDRPFSMQTPESGEKSVPPY